MRPILGWMLVLLFTSHTWGESRKLSAAGIKRAQQNLAVLEQNLKDTEKNIQIIRTNLETLQAETRTLSALELEHQSLKRKYMEFLTFSSKENEKNEKALRDLDQFTKHAQQLISKEPENVRVKAQLETAQRDLLQRNEWKVSNATKSASLQSLIAELDGGGKEIRQRHNEVQTQLNSWQNKMKEFESLQMDIKNKIQQTQALTKQPSPTVN